MRGLVGRWATDPNDPATVAAFGWVTQEFTGDGRLIYTIHAEATDQIMFLRYRIEGDELVTDQDSSPREERTPFAIEHGTVLLLGRAPEVWRFLREA